MTDSDPLRCAWCLGPMAEADFPAIGICLGPNDDEEVEDDGLMAVLRLDGRLVAGFRMMPGMPHAERGIDVLFILCSVQCEDHLSEALHWRRAAQRPQ